MNNQTPQAKPDTFETVLASLKETNLILSEKFAETNKLLSEKIFETDRMLSEKLSKTEKLIHEKSSNAEERFQKLEHLKDMIWEQIWETQRIVKENSKQIGGMGNSNGVVAESYFRNSFAKSMSFAGQEFDHIDAPLRRKNKTLNLQGEYDIVMYNGNAVAIIEIKYNADKEDVEQTLQKVEVFKKLFPQYQNYDIYLGLATLSIDEKAEKEAIKQGVGIIKQVGDTMVINDKNLKVF